MWRPQTRSDPTNPMPTPTGIAGAQDHHAAAPSSRCHVCRAEIDPALGPAAARVLPGVFAVVCSPACADDPRFSADAWGVRSMEAGGA